MRRHQVVGVVALLLLLNMCTVHAQSCSSYTVESDCYAQRATCRWNPFTPACIDGAPATCAQYFRDATGCATNVSCGKNVFNNACYTIPTATPVSALCNAQTTVQTCLSNNCYYDAYTPSTSSMGGKCYSSLSEVKQLFPSCNTYSYYPSNVFNDACSDARACTPLTATSLCQNPAGYNSNDVLLANRVTTSFVFSLLNPSLNLNTLQFSVINSIPTQQFLNTTAPMFHTLTVGTTANVARPLQPSKCNDLLVARPAYALGQPRITPAYPNTTALYNGLAASTNLVYTPAGALATALYQATGYTYVGNTSITQQVVVTPNTVNKVASFNADWAVANCGGTRTIVSTDETDYALTFTEDVQTSSFEASSAITIFTSLYTYGVAYFGATQRAAMTLRVTSPLDTAAGATVPGSMKRTFNASLTFRTTNPNVVLGLRSLQDVSMVATGGSVQSTPPTNCLGTKPVLVVPPTGSMPVQCADISPTVPPTYCWTTVVVFETRYNLPSPTLDGLGLVNCAYQPAATRIADMGSDIPYPTSLNGVNDFYEFAKQWPIGNLTTGPWTSVGTDTTGTIGDKMGVSLLQQTPIDLTYFAGTIAPPVCGMLPLATSPITDLIIPTYYNKNNVSFAVDLRNMALDTNSLLIFACMYPATSRIYQLNFKQSLVLLPLDATGEVIRTSAGVPISTLPWSSIVTTVPYTIRGVNGAHVSAVGANVWVDAFGVTIGDLMARMPSNGYAPVIPLYGTVPALPAASAASRRMLQTDDNDAESVLGATATFGVLLPANVTQPAGYIPDPDNKGATAGLAVLGVVGGVVGVAVIALAAVVSSGTAVSISTGVAMTVVQAAPALIAVGGTDKRPKKKRASSAHGERNGHTAITVISSGATTPLKPFAAKPARAASVTRSSSPPASRSTKTSSKTRYHSASTDDM